MANGEDEFVVKGLLEFAVESPKELERILRVGGKNRVTAETGMNARSSRSHAIFTIIVETKSQSTAQPGATHVRVGKLNLVDLAGSERQSKTGATGERLSQAIEINKSLVTLGMVINQLVEGAKHIPYRDSELTKLLSSSLGGSCKTVMIANVSPSSYNCDETIGTLRYASHAKKIKNTPKVNEDPKDSMLRAYEAELKRLRELLEAKKAGLPVGGLAAPSPSSDGHEITKELMEQLKKQTDEEVSRILADKGFAEQEIVKVREQMRQATQRSSAEKREREALEKKLKAMEGKLVGGGAQTLIDENQR
jgi:kinesin family protein 3/17